MVCFETWSVSLFYASSGKDRDALKRAAVDEIPETSAASTGGGPTGGSGLPASPPQPPEKPNRELTGTLSRKRIRQSSVAATALEKLRDDAAMEAARLSNERSMLAMFYKEPSHRYHAIFQKYFGLAESRFELQAALEEDQGHTLLAIKRKWKVIGDNEDVKQPAPGVASAKEVVPEALPAAQLQPGEARGEEKEDTGANGPPADKSDDAVAVQDKDAKDEATEATFLEEGKKDKTDKSDAVAKEPPVSLDALAVLEPYCVIAKSIDAAFDDCWSAADFKHTSACLKKKMAGIKELTDNMKGLQKDMVSKHRAARTSDAFRNSPATAASDTDIRIPLRKYEFEATEMISGNHPPDEVDWAVPWLLKGGRAYAETVRNDPAVQQAHHMFASRFENPKEEAAKKGRAQYMLPPDATVSPEAQELIRGLMPSQDTCIALAESDKEFLDADQEIGHFSCMSIYGFGPDMTYAGTEFLCVGCIRIQVDGSRKIALVDYATLKEMFVEGSSVRVEDASWQTVTHWAKGEHSKRWITQQVAARRLHLAVVVAGDAMWTPPGYFVLESTQQGLRGWGIRMPVITKAAVPSLRLLAADFEKADKKRGHLKAIMQAIDRI